ncbi:MAG TPA: hypothetical protein VM165_11165 [Planctomycetaceae bacterium]|nr:hypothetical protein [Planctomycetaceae bacterium]
MNRLFAVLIVLLLLVVGFGFYRGWFALTSRSPDVGSNKVNINLTVDGDKMQDDARAVQDKTAELSGKLTEEVNGPGDLATDKVKSVEP